MASEISRLAVILSANTSQFSGGLKGGESALESFKQKAEGTGSALSGLTGILATVGAAFAAMGAFEVFKEQEQSAAKLSAVLKSTGGAAGISRGEIDGLAESLSKTTTYSKAATQGAEAVLLTFTSIKGDAFKAAIPLIQDMSTLLGQDMKSSAIQLGKALNDPTEGVTALRRVGVSFTEQQLEQIKAMQEAGNMAGAQAVILNELSTEFGGQSSAAAQTYTGKIEQAKNALGEAAGVILGTFAPALTQLAGIIQSGAAWLQNHADAIRTVAKVIATIVVAIGIYKAAMLALTIAQQAWAAGQAIVLALQGPSGWATLAVAAGAATAGILAVNAAFDGVTAKAKDAGAGGNEALAKLNKELAKAGPNGANAAGGIQLTAKEAKKLGEEVQTATERLKEQVATFGMNSHEAEVYKLKMKGATDAQLEQADALAKQLEQLEAQKKAVEEQQKLWKEMQKDAEKWVSESRTPLEKLEDEIRNINELASHHLLTEAQRQRAIDKVTGDTFKPAKRFEFKSVLEHGAKLGAVEARFTQGFAGGRVSEIQKLQQAAFDQLKEAKKSQKILAGIERNTGSAEVWDF